MYAYKHRLRHEHEVKEVLATGRTRAGRFVRLKFVSNELGYPRFAVVVSKKVHKSAVVRNKKKRQIREILRKLHTQFGLPAFDLVVLVHKEILQAKYTDISVEISSIFSKIR